MNFYLKENWIWHWKRYFVIRFAFFVFLSDAFEYIGFSRKQLNETGKLQQLAQHGVVGIILKIKIKRVFKIILIGIWQGNNDNNSVLSAVLLNEIKLSALDNLQNRFESDA